MPAQEHHRYTASPSQTDPPLLRSSNSAESYAVVAALSP